MLMDSIMDAARTAERVNIPMFLRTYIVGKDRKTPSNCQAWPVFQLPVEYFNPRLADLTFAS